MPTSPLVEQILNAASRQGLTQRDVALRAGVAPETLSRLKHGGNPSLDVLNRLARAAGVEIRVASGPLPEQESRAFRERYKHLAWSNSKASEETLLVQALLKPRFQTLLDASVEFGLERVTAEWHRLSEQHKAEAARVASSVTRILGNIERGYHKAAA